MIVVEERGELLLVTQPDHARFAAELLSLWRRNGLEEHPRRRLLLDAVREHDNGWREADAAPRVDPVTGRPHDFRSLPDGPRREIWLRAVDRFADERPYVALLAARHALELHRRRRSEPGWSRFLEAMRKRLPELQAAAAVEDRDLAADYAWLRLADRLSLAVCNRWPTPVVDGPVEGRYRRQRLELRPFPLAGATTFRIPCRRLPARRFGGDAELAVALASARWRWSAVRCVPTP